MKYMRKNSFVVCLVISAILLTSSFAMPVLAAENTGIETSSVTRSVPGYYKCTGSDVNIRSGPGKADFYPKFLQDYTHHIEDYI